MMASRERRAKRPYYRKADEDKLTGIVVIAFAVGLLLGVTVTLGWIDISGGAL